MNVFETDINLIPFIPRIKMVCFMIFDNIYIYQRIVLEKGPSPAAMFLQQCILK